MITSWCKKKKKRSSSLFVSNFRFLETERGTHASPEIKTRRGRRRRRDVPKWTSDTSPSDTNLKKKEEKDNRTEKDLKIKIKKNNKGKKKRSAFWFLFLFLFFSTWCQWIPWKNIFFFSSQFDRFVSLQSSITSSAAFERATDFLFFPFFLRRPITSFSFEIFVFFFAAINTSFANSYRVSPTAK